MYDKNEILGAQIQYAGRAQLVHGAQQRQGPAGEVIGKKEEEEEQNRVISVTEVVRRLRIMCWRIRLGVWRQG